MKKRAKRNGLLLGWSIACFLTIATLSAQTNTYETSISSKLKDYMTATDNGDWETVMDMIYPKIFTVAPREQLMQTFQSIGEMGMKVRTNGLTVDSISTPALHDKEQFSLVRYSADLTLELTKPELQEPGFVQLLTNQFHLLYGKENVVYEDLTKAFRIKAIKSMFAIAPTGTSDWKFIENNPEQQVLMDMLIPQAIREKLKP